MTASRWLTAITRNPVQSALLGVAALAITGGVIAGPAQAASAGTPVAGDGGTPAPAATAPTDTADKNGKITEKAPAGKSTKDTAGQDTADKAAADKAVAGKAAADKAAQKTAAQKTAAQKTAAQKAAAKQKANQTANQAAPKAAPPSTTKTLAYDFKLQPNYYYCGPAATRIALSAHHKLLSHDQVAALLGTTTNGTNSAEDITRTLNGLVGAGRYHTTSIPGPTPTPAQTDRLRADIVAAVNQGDPVVANIAGTVSDQAGETHSYEGGHYLTVVGYADHGRTVTIADPADTVGSSSYQLSTIDLANWIATRGYSS